MPEETQTVKQIPKEIEKQIKKWEQQVLPLRSINALLSMSAIIFSLLAAANLEPYRGLTPYFAFFAAISVSLLSGLDISSKANRMRRAWRKLNVAIIKFEENCIPVCDLINAYEEAEEIIGDVKEFREPKSP